MAGKFSEKQYRPQRQQTPSPPTFSPDLDLDYTTPYPCGVCKRTFTSRYELANHPHPKRSFA